MSAPDYARGFLRVPNAVWEALFCRAPLTRRQLQLVAVVVRESWGWQERGGRVRLWTRPLRTRDFAARAGLAPDRIGRDLEHLAQLGVLRRHGSRWQFDSGSAALLPGPTAPKRRRGAAEPPPDGAGAAPPASGPKTGKTEERNDAYVPSAEDLPSGENPRDRADLFARLVEAAAGPLPPETARRLRARVARTGIAAVWRELEPAIADPARLRRCLRSLLDEGAGHGSGGTC